MGVRARPSRLRTPAGVQQWQAERTRRTARAGTDPGRARRYSWPTDREAIVEDTVTAGSGREQQRPGVCGTVLAAARLA